MQIGRGSTIQFTPDHSQLWVVEVTMSDGQDEQKSVVRPVIGWAVVVSYSPHEDPSADPDANERETEIEPVVLGHEGRPETESEFRRYPASSECGLFLCRLAVRDEWAIVARRVMW